jgi:hypothetical protein
MFSFKQLAGSLALSLLASSSLLTPADAAQARLVAVTGQPKFSLITATLDAGRLLIAGTAATAGMTIRVVGTNLVATSDAERRFVISASYRTPNCEITLA